MPPRRGTAARTRAQGRWGCPRRTAAFVRWRGRGRGRCRERRTSGRRPWWRSVLSRRGGLGGRARSGCLRRYRQPPRATHRNAKRRRARRRRVTPAPPALPRGTGGASGPARGVAVVDLEGRGRCQGCAQEVVAAHHRLGDHPVPHVSTRPEEVVVRGDLRQRATLSLRSAADHILVGVDRVLTGRNQALEGSAPSRACHVCAHVFISFNARAYLAACDDPVNWPSQLVTSSPSSGAQPCSRAREY